MNGLTTTTQHHPHRTVITVAGDMDRRTSAEIARTTSLVLPGCVLLQMDLSDVSFMDSSGLNLLLKLRRHLQAQGGSLSVTGLRHQPARLLMLTETYELLAAGTDGEHDETSPA
ncbi:STAS domain-containing protein [Streptomyces sp. NPDC093094]|uniref:STAS domain-containing protein n=1 Tax=Streptomyces sp. NPDC093094 TaxID=3366026 RepID=UPI0038077B42